MENMEGKGEFRWSIQGARKEGRKDRARGVFEWDQEGIKSGGGRDGRGKVNNKRNKLVRRKVEGEDAVYKRKYSENFGEGKRGSGGEKGSKEVNRGRLHCEDGRERGVGRRRGRKREGIEG